MSQPIACCSTRTRPRAPFCSRSTGSSPGARRAQESYESTIEFVSRAAACDRRRRRAAASGWAARRPRSSGTGRDAPPRRIPPRAPRRPARRRRRRRPRGRSEPRGGRIRVGAASARGQPDRRAVPRPPDQHEAQAAGRRVRPGARRRRELAAALRHGVAEYAPGTATYYERNLDDETRQFPIDPAGPRVVLDPRRRHRHVRAPTPGGRASRATSTTARSRSRTPPTRWAASARSARARRSRSSTGRSSATSSRRRRRAASSPAGSR